MACSPEKNSEKALFGFINLTLILLKPCNASGMGKYLKFDGHDRFFPRVAKAVFIAALLFTLYEATKWIPVDSLPQDNTDKLIHAFAFFVLALLIDMAYPASRFLFAKVLFLAFFGIFIELVQVYLPWRSAEVMDFVADSIGMALYFVPVLAVRQMLERRGRFDA